MRGRWLVVLTTAAALVLLPLAVASRPTGEAQISTEDLLGRIRASGDVGWSGRVQSIGGLQVPDTDAFANLADLLGERNDLRAWWRGPEEWRVDSIRNTGETNIYRAGSTMVRWVFESQRASVSPVSTVRLPDASDLLPPTLARLLLEDAPPEALDRLPARRIAGVATTGLRMRPSGEVSSLVRIDVWADPDSGLPLLVEAYGEGDRRPVLSTLISELDLRLPAEEVVRFGAGDGVEVVYEESVDVAAAANAFAPSDLPATLGGLPARGGVDPGAVGFYGSGPASLIVLPLRGQVAGPLRQRLRDSPAAEETSTGTSLAAGPVGLLLTPRGEGGSFLLAGTVTAGTLRRVAADLRQQR